MQSLGLVGLGAFGQLIAKELAGYFEIKAFDSEPGARRIASRFHLELCPLSDVARAKWVVLSVPILSLEAVAQAMAPHLRSGTTILDVTSVKVRPATILQKTIPPEIDIVSTHPLFGPQSTRSGLQGHKMVLCPIRSNRVYRVRRFLETALKLRVYISTPEQHDREMAVVQGLTHLVARIFSNIGQFEPEYSTVSFEHLMKAVELVRNDSEELFFAIERDNPYARSMRDKFFQSVDLLKLRLEHGHKIGPEEVRRLSRAG